MFGTVKDSKYTSYLMPLIALILMSATVIAVQYNSYREDTIQLGKILTETEEDEITYEKAVEILDKYGYVKEGKSSFYRQFLWTEGMTITGAFAAYLLIVFGIKRQEKSAFRRYKDILEAIEKDIEELREGSYGEVESSLSKCLKGLNSNPEAVRIDTALDKLNGNFLLIKQKAEADKKETKDVVTDISHQLKTPLAAVKSTFEILQNQDLSQEEREEFEERMAFQIDSLEKLTASLVNISRLESGMISIQLRKGKLFDSILDAVNGVWQKAEEKNIVIELEEGETEKLPEIMQDRKWLTEAFINILENAVKYSKENTAISIRVFNMNSMVRIEFADQGIGISPNEKHKIFQRFYRGEKEEIRRESGSGVGLYLARYIISRHGGTIMVKDNRIDGEKCGSIFVVQIPLLRRSLTNL